MVNKIVDFGCVRTRHNDQITPWIAVRVPNEKYSVTINGGENRDALRTQLPDNPSDLFDEFTDVVLEAFGSGGSVPVGPVSDAAIQGFRKRMGELTLRQAFRSMRGMRRIPLDRAEAVVREIYVIERVMES
jgi:hypothetical protein